MKRITRRDILGPRQYAAVRDDYRKRVIEHKKLRRVIVGERVSLVFEDRLTLRFQIEEMLRAEGIEDEAKIRDEIDVYNTMLPGEGALSATLFLEIPRDEDPREALGRLVGLDEHVVLVLGASRVRAAFEPGRQEADRISAVQYVKFPLDEAARLALRAAGTPLAIEIDHPHYRERAAMSDEMRASLAKDLDED